MFSDLKIPPEVLQHILPSENLSVTDFLSFKMPPPSGRSPSTQAAQIFVVPEPPQTPDINQIISAPVPVASVVEDLLECIQASFATAGSVAYNLESNRKAKFPLWIMTYWNEVHHLHEDRQYWTLAEQTLQELHLQRAGAQELSDKVHAAFSQLPRSGPVCGFSEDSDVIELHQYVTSKWLKTVHENQMLDLLQKDLDKHHAAPKTIDIQDT
jgi:hypothetical protein